MIAGTIVVFGDAARPPGSGPSADRSWRSASVDDPVDLSLRLHLSARSTSGSCSSGSRTRYGLPVEERHLTGFYRRYSGDLADLGKGEILAWTA